MFLRTRRELKEVAHHHEHREHNSPHLHHDHDYHEIGGFQDAHEREHAEEIERRFAGRSVTTPQIILFGITGGLMPCPAAFSVLLVCLQLKRVSLGFAMVGAFSFGIALTMVATGALVALSVLHAQKRLLGFGELVRRAPYVSCLMVTAPAFYMAWQGCPPFDSREAQDRLRFTFLEGYFGADPLRHCNISPGSQ